MTAAASPRSVTSRVVTVASVFAGLDLLAGGLAPLFTGGLEPGAIFFFSFGAVFVGLAFATWREKRGGYLALAIFGTGVLGSDALDPSHTVLTTLQNPASSSFITFFTFVAAMAVAIPYGFYGFYAARRPVVQPRVISRTSAWALIGVGIAIGGLFVGALAAATQARLISTAGTGKDVTIAVGAVSANNPNFYLPETLTVQVGKEVIWFNGDTSAHTVTSTGSPPVPFDSGNMNSGDVFKFRFSQAGTYEYYCAYHDWMTGTVIAQSG